MRRRYITQTKRSIKYEDMYKHIRMVHIISQSNSRTTTTK